MKRVVYNISSIRAPLSGIGRYAVQLLSGLTQANYPVTAIHNRKSYSGERLLTLLNSFDVPNSTTSTETAISYWRRHVGRIPFSRQIYRRLDKINFQKQVQHITKPCIVHDINFTGSAMPPKKWSDVSTFFDLSFLDHANTHPSSRVHYLRSYLRTMQQSDCQIITISNSIKQELIETQGISKERIHVTQLAADKQFQPRTDVDCLSVLNQYGLRFKQYVLCVGTLEPRKNLITVLDAFEAMDSELQQAFPLVVVGALGWKTGELTQRLIKLQQRGVLIRLGFIPQAQLPILYAAASLFLYPSLYEGFGLPVLEAMQSGCPVITSNSGALAELAGQAAITIEPTNAAALLESMSNLLEDKDQQNLYSEAGRKHAEKFSWQETVDQTIKVYHAL